MQNLKNILAPLYGEKESAALEQKITDYIQSIPLTPFKKQPNWYKNLNFYITYPDGVEGPHPKPLQNLQNHLEWIKNLGCNAIHILPFLASPMIDKGFDISDFYNVRPELGTKEDLLNIHKRAQELDIQLFMDIVANHVSSKHEWFQKAESGDEFYRKFFFYTQEKPTLIRTFHTENGFYAEYMVDGKPKEVYIMFPEMVGELPHWYLGKDGLWYYHTFYPQQPDVNWFNPEVFFEFAKILIYWTNLGFHFRLDAIPFIGKGIYKDAAIDDKKTHAIVRALYQISRLINPSCAFLVETYESMESVINYFGTTNNPETTLSYNFHLCTNTWLSLVKENVSYFKDCFTQTSKVPIHAEWITFLRNHDELGIAFIGDDLREELTRKLIPYGTSFRAGHAVTGRTFSLLGNNPQRLLMAYCLAASVPGTAAIPYGDEVGMENIPLETLTETDQKDTRNINRGVLTTAVMEKGHHIYTALSDIFNKRRLVNYYLNIEPEMEQYNDGKVLLVRYKHGTSELLMFINISATEQNVPYEGKGYETVLLVNIATFDGSEVKLGAYGCLWLQK